MRKQLITIALFMVIGLTGYCQTDTIRGKQFHLTGKMTQAIGPVIACGIFAWANVVQFDIIELTGMHYPKKQIGIIITCPAFYKNNFFEKGKTYQLVFSDQNQADFGWSIIDKELLKKNGLSFEPYAVRVEKMQ